MLNLDKLDNMELSAKQDLDWKSLMQLCEVSQSDVFNGIYAAYKYGFQRGQTAERRKNNKKPRNAPSSAASPVHQKFFTPERTCL